MEKDKISRINSSLSDSFKIDGIVLHAVLEELFDSNSNYSTEIIKDEVIKFYGQNGINKISISQDQDRLYRTINGVQNILLKLQDQFSTNKFEKVLKEHEYLENDEFTGIADLLLRGTKNSVIIDYKSGQVLDENGSVKKNFINQMIIYGYLETEEYSSNQVQFYILDIKGVLHEIYIDLDEIEFKIEEIRKEFSEFIEGRNFKCIHENCLHCYIPHNCKNYTPPSNFENINSVSGEFKDLSELGDKKYKLQLIGIKKPYKNLEICIYFEEPINSTFRNEDLLTVNNLQFVRKSNEKVFFKVRRFWNINLIQQ